MRNLSDILGVLCLTPEQIQKVHSCLGDFDELADTDKEDHCPIAAEVVFPVVFGENAAIKSDSKYTESREATWSTNCQLTPRVIVTPTTAQDVGKTLALCQFLHVKFSIRGAGHLHNPGFNSNEDGVVISTSKFSDLTLSEDRSTAEIGFGLTWLEVYKRLDPYGLTVTGGRVPSVGVAGLLLGGGLSFQNSEHGLSCNAVVEYEVVLADSSIVKANATENPDLFWALKGGGPNFGIVTKAKMLTVPNKVWAEGRIYSPSMNQKLLSAVMQYHEVSEKDNKATLIWHSVHEATLLVFFYCAPVESPPVFECFGDIPFLAHIVEPGCRTVFDVVNGFASVNAGQRKSHDMRTMTSLPDLEVYKAAEQSRLEQIDAIKHIPGALLTMVIQPMSSSTIEACNAKGGNPFGLKPENHQWFLLMADWSNPRDEPAMLEASRKIVEHAESTAKKNGTFLDFRYSNYASRDQDPLGSYGFENVGRLRDVARRYDPDGVFQRLQFGGWLVSRVGLPVE